MGVDGGVENLEANLIAIKAVLTDAEMRRWNEEAVKLWLEDLKDVSYDMDSVLDEWNTTILMSELDQGGNRAESSTSQITKTKVWCSILFSCFNCTKLSPPVIIYRHHIAEEIQSLNQKLGRINDRKNMFGFRSNTIGDTIELRWPDFTTSFLDVPVIYGPMDNKKILINQLTLGGSSQEEQGLKFIPIVGMGGIGKTTLARNAYNDPAVKTLFGGNMIWVCVSDPFDIGRIAKESIEQLTGVIPTVIGSESLMRKFREAVNDKKFLLVLDDVWTTDYSKWLLLVQILKLGAIGSRVVVTTRNEEVAKMIGDTNNMICVNKLGEEDCWLLLKEIALSNKTEQEKQNFDAIGRKIARKCNGLPLAAKALGSLLRVKDIEYWHEMLRSEIWELKNMEVELFNPLLFSYYDLTPVERRCFMYCSIFPKDNVFRRDYLIQQWVAQDYFKSMNDGKHEDEQRGLVCFQNLATRSFFQEFEFDNYNFTMECKMHDIVHDFACYLTKNEYSIELISDVEKRVDLDIRHLNLIYVSSSVTPTFSNLKKKNLHTLMVTCDSMLTGSNNSLSSCMFPYDLLDLKRLKTLILKGESMKIPVSIGDLIHLRYFSIRSYDIIDVPPTIGNLFNLQTLKFYCCITELPEEVGELMNLRHLHLIKGCTKSLPKSIWALTRLQTLDIGGSIKVGVLGDIRILNNLCIIRLEGLGKEEHKEEAKEAQLLNKKALVHLHLKFDKDSSVMDTHEIVLDSLQPHHENLKSLRIEEYCGLLISPSWMLSLTNLRNLDLYGCFNCITLPPLGKLPCLESLCIDSFPGLKKIGSEFLGEEKDSKSLFPKLEKFEINFADSLEEWVGVAGWTVNGPLKIMPCLESLEMSFCGLLRTLPDFLRSTPLKNLVVAQCDILEKSCEMEKIRHVPNITIC
ncbi:putative disease resistance protein RGA3 isoform X2 [Cannabis sativa]|nr:putative disease resistance protein RGA3 isoform X2 [Cannabis sativa]XP_060973483.1 putative disease resistance protein RGA3 isoform X2 [Cannabis sativa]XP_060973484.1 putative disease resistance protein RGA3 isoform X2 [Cannabis sativa]XP_060973485.1 putative disease resistance protein RGA3 isoform X2 [Cannabis sativa]